MIGYILSCSVVKKIKGCKLKKNDDKNQYVKQVKCIDKGIRHSVIILTCLVIFMFAFTYLMVPIFTYACQKLGINGKNVMTATVPKTGMQLDESRLIKVEFASTIHGNVGFKFEPLQRVIRIHPGERKLIYFYAENQTGKDKTIQAVPSITPADGARFFKKIECFCFTQQFFKKGEKADMFVNFYIDPSVPKNIKEITLAYTLFDVTDANNKKPITSKGRIAIL